MSSEKNSFDDVSKDIKKNLDKATNEIKKGIKSAEDAFKESDLKTSKTTLLSILSLLFPIGGFMLYLQLASNKKTEKLASKYLSWAILGAIVYIIITIFRVFLNLF